MSEARYAGPATVTVAATTVPVQVTLDGAVQPVDGRFHWGGRIAPAGDGAARLVAWVRDGGRAATLRAPGGPEVPVRLTEVDPWGGIKVTASGPPPWPRELPQESTMDNDAAADVGSDAYEKRSGSAS